MQRASKPLSTRLMTQPSVQYPAAACSGAFFSTRSDKPLSDDEIQQRRAAKAARRGGFGRPQLSDEQIRARFAAHHGRRGFRGGRQQLTDEQKRTAARQARANAAAAGASSAAALQHDEAARTFESKQATRGNFFRPGFAFRFREYAQNDEESKAAAAHDRYGREMHQGSRFAGIDAAEMEAWLAKREAAHKTFRGGRGHRTYWAARGNQPVEDKTGEAGAVPAQDAFFSRRYGHHHRRSYHHGC